MSGCQLPGRDEPLFTVQDGMMEMGLGVHGEAGCAIFQVRVLLVWFNLQPLTMMYNCSFIS